MTKHPDDATAQSDRPALLKSKEARKRYDSAVHEYREALERGKDALAFKSVDFTKSYVEGRLSIFLRYKPVASIDHNGREVLVVWAHDGEAGNREAGARSAAVDDGHFSAIDDGPTRDEQMVLVGDVESVDAVEFASVLLEGFYLVQNKGDRVIASDGALQFVSLQRACCVDSVIGEREECVPVDLATIGFHQRAVRVVQGTPQIVDSITDYGRGVEWKVADTAFPTVVVAIASQGAGVRPCVSPNNRFELVDVMIGPFHL